MEDEEKLNQVRKDIVNIEQNYHFNNAGASPMPVQVVSSVKAVLDLECEKGKAGLRSRWFFLSY